MEYGKAKSDFFFFHTLGGPFCHSDLVTYARAFQLHHNLLDLSVAEQLSTTQLVWLLRFEKGPSRNGMGWRFVQHELRALKATIFRGSWSELEDRCATKEHDSVLNCVGLMVDRGQDSEGEKLLVIPVLVLLIASNGPTRCPNARASA